MRKKVGVKASVWIPNKSLQFETGRSLHVTEEGGAG